MPNWGLRVTTVETTQEALDRLRAAATQGPPWTYGVVLADLASMRNTAIALHRNVGRARELRRRAPGLPVLRRRSAAGTAHRRDAAAAPGARCGTARGARATRASAARRREERKAHDSDKPAKHWQARVLLVEDNPVNLLVAQRLLSVLGLECDTATNGEAALMRMRDGNYDLVLMDCQMPVLDGYSAARKWREIETADPTGPHLPIVAMTANAMAGDRQRCLEAGMDDYLAKPVTRGQLEHCLRRWLQEAAACARAVGGSVRAMRLRDRRCMPGRVAPRRCRRRHVRLPSRCPPWSPPTCPLRRRSRLSHRPSPRRP